MQDDFCDRVLINAILDAVMLDAAMMPTPSSSDGVGA
jgi:hypothetical protein